MPTYAFIDHANLLLGVRSQGWKLDFRKFRAYLHERYGVDRVFLFIGYVRENESVYGLLRSFGYELVFKPAVRDAEGGLKANCDADLVLEAALRRDEYVRAVIVSGDGDFYSLVQWLARVGRLVSVMAPSARSSSYLLRQAAGTRFVTLDNASLRARLRRGG